MITYQNANLHLKKKITSPSKEIVEAQAKAWMTVYDFCRQEGMESNEDLSGLQSVIKFIASKVSSKPS